MKQGKKSKILFAVLAAAGSLFGTFPSMAGVWEPQEDGRWRYMEAPGDPLTDEWLTLDGKEYYLDSKGYMKTGWVTDKESNERYYMGEDGAKCFCMFTPDNHYIGSDGTVLKTFDSYRKSMTKKLQSFLKKGASQAEGQSGFLLTDLNGDFYPDLAVFDSVTQPKRVLLVSVWNPEEEELADAAMSDLDSEEYSVLGRNPQNSQVWLTITGTDGSRNYFSLEHNGFQFQNEWNLETGKDDWGEMIYFADGEETEAEEWCRIREMADGMAGDPIAVSLLPLEEASILQAVNRAPAREELYLWE